MQPRQRRWLDGYHAARQQLIAAQSGNCWRGKLSDSALATAVAVEALATIDARRYKQQIDAGLNWLKADRNSDGGWGDSPASPSNPSATTLVLAAIKKATGQLDNAAMAYIDSCGGIAQTLNRYGNDRTFSVPILAACAIAALVDFADVPKLPLELAALPRWTFRLGPMPVVSYALPALISMGLLTASKNASMASTLRLTLTGAVLRRLKSIQPASGGFLEAAPLTGFCAMALSAAKLGDHPVASEVINAAVLFLLKSQRSNGSWPIDEDLACWNTSNAALALGEISDENARWLLGCQQKYQNIFTGAPPGGWGWTDLPGSLPDADDTSAAILALLQIDSPDETVLQAITDGANWLLALQNADGGWPTFCRGWGKLPFDSSCSDISAHAARALHAASKAVELPQKRVQRSISAALSYLQANQLADGSFAALWFGSQQLADHTNPVISTSRVLRLYSDLCLQTSPQATRGVNYLISAASPDGRWGPAADTAPSIEETAMAIAALAGYKTHNETEIVAAALDYLSEMALTGQLTANPAPVGLYFASLWYSQDLYPLSWTTEAFRLSCQAMNLL